MTPPDVTEAEAELTVHVVKVTITRGSVLDDSVPALTTEMRTVEIHVTESDLREGIIFRCEDCPAVRAINRALRPGLWASISYHFVSIFGPSLADRVDIQLPNVVVPTLIAIDQHRFVQPFAFTLELPVSVLRDVEVIR